MRVLILDPSFNALDLAMRAKRDGHDVRLCCLDKEKNKYIGQGLVNVTHDPAASYSWADLIIHTDNTRWLRETDALRRQGKAIIGATAETAKWELDRECGMQILEEYGVDYPPYECFSDYDKAIQYVMKSDTRLVSKPSGDADKTLSYVSKGPADLIYMLQRWKRAGKLKGVFMLQEFKEGIEMAVGGWIGPSGFNKGWCENWEFKKFMVGDLGTNVGEMGTVLRFVRKSKLANQMLKPLEEELVDSGYVGYIDVNCIIDEKGKAWPLEFTMRMGWPTYNIQQAVHQGDCIEGLNELVDGNVVSNFEMDTIAIGVVLAIPDFPLSLLTKKEVTGIPIYGVTEELEPHVHFCEAMLTEAPDAETMKPIKIIGTAGDYVLVMTATGDTVRAARTEVYGRLKQLIVPNSPMYRTDIGDRLAKQLPQLQAHGYATGMAFSTPKPKPAEPPKGERIGNLEILYV